MIAPKVASLALNPALLVRLRRRAELALEAPMRTEDDEARHLLAAMTAQDPLHRALEVIVSEQPKDPAKIVEGVLMSLEKRLRRRALIRAMEGRAAEHAAHRE